MEKRSSRRLLSGFFIVFFTLFSFPLLGGRHLFDDREDIKVIRRAVQKTTIKEPDKKGNPRWFKVMFIDRKNGRGEIKITLPVALVDLILLKAEGMEKKRGENYRSGEFKLDDSCFLYEMKGKWRKQVSLLELWQELKSLGPASLIEIKGDEGIMRVWIE